MTAKRPVFAVLILLAGLVLAIPLGAVGTPVAGAALDAPVTKLHIDPEVGAYIGEGQQHHFTSLTAGLRGANILTFWDPTTHWQAWFVAPNSDRLAVGTYENAQRADTRAPGHPGIELFGGGRGCNRIAGRFIVDQIELAANGTPLVFSARFEHHCEGWDAATFGVISYNATADFRTRTFSANSLTFGSLPHGEVSAPQVVTITNQGPSPLAVQRIALTGTNPTEFSIASTTCNSAVLPAGQNCSVSVRFAPNGSAGPRSAKLTIFDDMAPSGGAGTGRDIVLSGASSGGVNAAGEFTAVTPARVLDTRYGVGRKAGPIGPGKAVSVQITGTGGVPTTDVAAVVMNVTGTEPTVHTYLTVWPGGQPRPLISNLNLRPGQTAPNLVTVGVDALGKVNLYNAAGNTHAIFDIVGFYAGPNGSPGSRFHGVEPFRLFDTREAYGERSDGRTDLPSDAVGPGETIDSMASGWGEVPVDGVTALILNVTVTAPTSAGYLTVYPSNVLRPTASNLNFVAGETVPNLVTVRVDELGSFNIYNAFGQTHVIVDVVGYYDENREGETGRFVAVAPERTVDTRETEPLGPNDIGVLTLAGHAGIPATGAVAAVLNVTVTEPTVGGYLSVFPDDACAVPLVSNLNFTAGQTVPNLVISRLSSPAEPGCAIEDGAVDIYNAYGSTHVIVDVFGYFTA